MNKRIGLFLGFLAGAVTAIFAQDSTKVKVFDFTKIKPVVQFFGNAEYNPTADQTKDCSFWIGRTLFGFQYEFDRHWSGRVLVDRTRLTGSANTMYVKVANLRWAPGDKLAIEAGAVNQNNFIPFENFWGYRFVAETFQDRYYAIPSSDLGVAVYYRLGRNLMLDAAVTNGEGPRLDQDEFGRLKLAGGITVQPAKQLHARLFYHFKPSGNPAASTGEHLFNVNLGWKPGSRLRFGADFSYVSGFQNTPTASSYGGTLFGCFSLYKTLTYIVRFDRLILNNQPAAFPWADANAIITGFSLSPAGGITLCLNYQGTGEINRIWPSAHRLLFSFEYKI